MGQLFQGKGLGAIRNFFDYALDYVTDPKARVCLFLKASADRSPDDETVARHCSAGFAMIQTVLEERITEAQEAGEARRDVSSAELASSVLAVIYGLQILAKGDTNRQILIDACNGALKQLQR